MLEGGDDGIDARNPWTRQEYFDRRREDDWSNRSVFWGSLVHFAKGTIFAHRALCINNDSTTAVATVGRLVDPLAHLPGKKSSSSMCLFSAFFCNHRRHPAGAEVGAGLEAGRAPLKGTARGRDRRGIGRGKHTAPPDRITLERARRSKRRWKTLRRIGLNSAVTLIYDSASSIY